MSMNIPVIMSSNLGIVDEFQQNEKNKLLLVDDIKNMECLINELEKVISNDSKVGESLKAGYKFCTKNSWEESAQRYDQLWQNQLEIKTYEY